MVGIWCVALWQQLGQPGRLHVVELGPGRGTLMADLLRGTSAFQPFSRALEVGMVEISPVLRWAQRARQAEPLAANSGGQREYSGPFLARSAT